MGEELEHVRRPDLLRVLAHHGEEGLEVEGHGPQGVGSGSSGDELQVAIEQWVTKFESELTVGSRRADEAGGESDARMLPTPGEMDADARWITRVLGDRWLPRGRKIRHYERLRPAVPLLATGVTPVLATEVAPPDKERPDGLRGARHLPSEKSTTPATGHGGSRDPDVVGASGATISSTTPVRRITLQSEPLL